MGSDFQRTLMWVVLAASCFMLWDNWQVYNGKPSFFGAPKTEQVAQSASADANVTPTNLDTTFVSQSVKTTAPVTFSNDLVKLTVDESGAVVTKAELLKEKLEADWTETGLVGLILGKKETEQKNVVLFNATSGHTYVAQSGLIGGDFPNHKTQFKHVGTTKTGDITKAVFVADSGNVTLEKTFELKEGNYGIEVSHKVVNNSGKTVTPSIYYQLSRDDAKPAGESSFYSTYTGPAMYTADSKFKKIGFGDIEGVKPSNEVKADNGWIAMIQHYFLTAWADVDHGAEKVQRTMFTTKLSDNLYAISSVKAVGTIADKDSKTVRAVLYAGPQNQDRLEKIADGLDLVVDYGWLTFLAKPIYNVLHFLHSLVGNWGWAIVLLTCLVKLILYPVSAAGYKSMARMKEVTPKMKELQQLYGNDKQRYQQALMELYKKEKINPVGGCLPIALQIPVFLALYWVLLASVELRGSEWILWISDLAMPDGWFILPLIMMATMLFQIKLNPTPADPMQARMMYIMPLMFGVMFFFFASGLVLYWLTNNILSIWQQWYVNKAIAADRARRIAEAKAK